MSESDRFSDKGLDLKSTDIKEIEKHYQGLIDRHIKQARLPMAYGWTSQVMMSLIWRLGKTPLEIGIIADELDLPSRTLQNHLSNEGTSFTYLRERVRQHFAIKLLTEGKQVEEIYPMLDFADRTGLINAFKRWTGLPPNHFKKMYYAYVKGKV